MGSSGWIASLGRRVSVVVLGVLAFTGIYPVAADAAPAWGSAVRISMPGASASEVAVAIDAAGEAVAVWKLTRDDGLVIQSASRPPHGAWSAPVEVSRLDKKVFLSSRPKIAINDAGEVVALWVLEDGNDRIVQSASRPPGGAWSIPVRLSPGPVAVGHPEIAINDAGEAVAVWETTPISGPPSVDSASRPAGGSWSAPVSISSQKLGGTRPKVAINSAGEAVAVWEREDCSRCVVQSAARPPGGAWSAPVTLSKGRDLRSRNPEIAIGDAGEAVAVWEGGADVDSTFVRSASRLPGGAWSAPSRVSTGLGAYHPFPQLAVNSAGEAVVVWKGLEGFGPTIMSASRLPGRSWTSPRRIDRRPQVIFGPDVGIDAAGEAVVVWGRASFGRKGEMDAIFGTSRPRGAAWSAPTRVGGIGHGGEELPEVKGVDGLADVAVNSAGEAVVVWEQLVRGKTLVVKAAVRP